MPMLQQQYPIRSPAGDILIDDAESFCRKVLHDYARTNGSHYQPDDEDDAISYLLGLVWRLPTLYNTKPRDVSFTTYAYRLLTLRCVSELRDREGRTRWQFATHTYERERPIILHLDQPQTDDHTRTLGDSLAIRDSGTTADRDTTVERLEQSRHRERTRDLDHIHRHLSQPTAA